MDPCREVRESVLGLTLEKSKAELPPDLARHLRQCAACTNYREGVNLPAVLFKGPPLYTHALKLKTLHAVEETNELSGRWLTVALVPLAICSLFLSVVAPVWVGSSILERWISSPAAWWASALALSTYVGAAVAWLGFAATRGVNTNLTEMEASR